MNLVWFVKDAMDFAELPEALWDKLPKVAKIGIIREWEDHIHAKIDFVLHAKLTPQKTKQLKVTVKK